LCIPSFQNISDYHNEDVTLARGALYLTLFYYQSFWIGKQVKVVAPRCFTVLVSR
jgi:hypothetical protein